MIKSRKKFEVVAEDNNSPFIRNWIFCKGISNYRLLKMHGPNMGILSTEGKIYYLMQQDTWVKAHEELKKRVLKNPDYVETLIDLAEKHGQAMNKWTASHIFQKDLSQFSDTQLISLYKKFTELDAIEYTYGVSLPILDFQGFSLVENTLEIFLKQHVPAKKFQDYFSVFTYPIKNSFSQDQEESLLRLTQDYYTNPEWRKMVRVGSLKAIQKKFPLFYRRLKLHTKRFAWVYYVYQGPAYTEADFLGFIRGFLEQRTNPKKRLQQLRLKKNTITRLKKRYLQQLRPNDFNLKMLKLAAKMVWAKPRRKDYQSCSYYHVEKLQREIGKRLFLSLGQVQNLSLSDLRRMFSGKPNPALANEIFAFHICIRTGDYKVAILWGKKAKQYAKKYFFIPKKTSGEHYKSLKKIIGQIAFAGKAKGTVRIINRPEEMHKMQRGDILVSVATTPSIVPAMKKAAAIVTEEGGLTCHASIVSRELEIPCVVGTKIATKVFRDGEKIEVDATTGIIKKM